MYSTSDIRKGLKIEMEGAPYEVIEFMHVKPGKGQAFVRTKVRNLLTGSVLDRTYKTGEKLYPADLSNSTGQYLYREGENFVVMDNESYEQHELNAAVVGDAAFYLRENDQIQLLYYKGVVVSLTPPNFVELEVVDTEPELKGATASGGPKPAKLSTGAALSVPQFVAIGDRVKVDTRTGAYIERVS